MIYRWIGAVLITAGCGGFGFSLAAEYHRQEQILGSLLRALKVMQWELQYRLTPLPELCMMAGRQSGGTAGKIFRQVSHMLDQQSYPDVSSCMQTVLASTEGLTRNTRALFRQLGTSLGRFDLPGQLDGIQSVAEACRQEKKQLEQGKVQRLRSYRTLSLCAGAALAILLF